MRLPHLKKKFIAGALAAGLVMGAGGIAAAYLSASGSGTGSASVGSAKTVSVVTITAKNWVPGTPHVVAFSVTNPNTFSVTLATPATITSAKVGTCHTAGADTAPVTSTPASTAMGKVAKGKTAASGTEEPSFTVATVTFTQAGCKVTLTIHV